MSLAWMWHLIDVAFNLLDVHRVRSVRGRAATEESCEDYKPDLAMIYNSESVCLYCLTDEGTVGKWSSLRRLCGALRQANSD